MKPTAHDTMDTRFHSPKRGVLAAKRNTILLVCDFSEKLTINDYIPDETCALLFL